MFCHKCGAEIGEAAFCPKCGAKIEANQLNEKNDGKGGDAPLSNMSSTVQQEDKKKKNIGMIIGIAAAAFLLLIISIAAIKNHRTNVKLDKYANVEFEGYDSLGQASVVFDWEAFERDYGGKLKINKSALKKLIKTELTTDLWGYNISAEYVDSYMNEFTKDGATSILQEYVNGSAHLDSYSNLSNGDEVILSWNFRENEITELETILRCRLKYDDESKYTVTGLEPVGTFDPFDGVNISYSGIAPDGKANVDYDASEYGYYLNYNIDKRDGLSNGETITVTISINGSEDSFVSNYGKLPYPTEKAYTVEGLMAYISTASEIPDALLDNMKVQAEDIIKATAARTWEEEVSIKSLTYLGNYFLLNKGKSYGPVNQCALVYRVEATMTMQDAKNDVTVAQDQDVYYYVTFQNLMTEEDGSGAVDISDYKTTSSRFKAETEIAKATGWYEYNYAFTFYGFENIDKL